MLEKDKVTFPRMRRSKSSKKSKVLEELSVAKVSTREVGRHERKSLEQAVVALRWQA